MKRLLLMLLLVIPGAAHAAKVQEITTPRGFTIWLVEEHSLPIITTNVSFTGSGIAYDPAGKEGRTNMAAALLLEGAGDRNSQQFNEALEDDAIRLNVGADDDTVQATLEVLSEHQAVGFSLLSDMLLRPRFDAEPMARMRAKMKALLLEQSGSPTYVLSKNFQEDMFGAHPYHRMGVGNDASIDALTSEDLRFFTTHYLTRENIIISVVGDTTADEITKIIDDTLGALPERYAPDTVVTEAALPEDGGLKTIAHDMPQSMVRFGLPGLKRNDPDYIPAYVANYMLGGGGLSSRLAEEIRVKRGLAYSVHSQLLPKTYAGVWQGAFATRNDQVKQAIATLRDVLAAYARDGATESELADAKAYLTGSFILDLSSNAEVADFITMMQQHKLGSDYINTRNALIEKVTLADVKRVNQRLIMPEKLRLVIVGKPEMP